MTKQTLEAHARQVERTRKNIAEAVAKSLALWNKYERPEHGELHSDVLRFVLHMNQQLDGLIQLEDFLRREAEKRS